jgi:hypothetical protein
MERKVQGTRLSPFGTAGRQRKLKREVGRGSEAGRAWGNADLYSV